MPTSADPCVVKNAKAKAKLAGLVQQSQQKIADKTQQGTLQVGDLVSDARLVDKLEFQQAWVPAQPPAV